MALVYLDNSATTCVLPEAADKAHEMMTKQFGNPSSLHTLGFLAEQEIRTAREAVASKMGADAECVTFTSGGTESNNLALIGAAMARRKRGNRIVVGATEHPSVLNTCAYLESCGFEVIRVMPQPDGIISGQDLLDACDEQTILVSCMLVNNETGALFPWETMVKPIRKKSPLALLHCDAVQGFGKVPVFAKKWDLDLLSCSGHKVGAPKGIGALYVKKGTHLASSFALGGGQEKGIRSGTENTPGIAAFGTAVRLLPSFKEQEAHYLALRDLMLRELKDEEDVIFHLPSSGVPYVVHLSVLGRKSETLVHFLAGENVYVSGGSACSKGKKSHVLTAMNLSPAEIDSSLRVSFCPQTSTDDVLAFVRAIRKAKTDIVSVK